MSSIKKGLTWSQKHKFIFGSKGLKLITLFEQLQPYLNNVHLTTCTRWSNALHCRVTSSYKNISYYVVCCWRIDNCELVASVRSLSGRHGISNSMRLLLSYSLKLNRGSEYTCTQLIHCLLFHVLDKVCIILGVSRIQNHGSDSPPNYWIAVWTKLLSC